MTLKTQKKESSYEAEEEDDNKQDQPQLIENKGDKVFNDSYFMLGIGTRTRTLTGCFNMIRYVQHNILELGPRHT